MTEETNQQSNIGLLLVEDHLLTRISLKTILARTQDIKVIAEASDGKGSIDLALKLKPNIILMDGGLI